LSEHHQHQDITSFFTLFLPSFLQVKASFSFFRSMFGTDPFLLIFDASSVSALSKKEIPTEKKLTFVQA
jgi:hypothetical protein